MGSPEVLTGARAPRSERMQEAERQRAERAQRGSGIADIPAGKVVFQAVALRYRLQLTAPEERKLSDGRVIRDRALVAKFDDGLIVLDEKKDAHTIELIRNHQDYGTDFWDFQEKIAQARARKTEEAVKSLADVAATPEGRQRLREALAASGDDDFAAPKAGKGNAPVASQPA